MQPVQHMRNKKAELGGGIPVHPNRRNCQLLQTVDHLHRQTIRNKECANRRDRDVQSPMPGLHDLVHRRPIPRHVHQVKDDRRYLYAVVHLHV